MKKEILVFSPAILFGIYWAMVKVALPIVPLLPSYFDTSSQSIQQIFSVAFILSGLFPIIWGPVIDNVELKKFILVNGIVFIILSILLSFSTNIYMFGTLFIASCCIASAFVIVGRTLPFLYFENHGVIQKSLVYGMFGGYFGAWFAPFLAGYLVEHVQWRSIFYIIPCITIVLMIIAFKLPIQKETDQKRTLIKNIVSMFEHCKLSSFRLNVLILALFAFFQQSIVISVPFWVSEVYQVPSYVIGYMLFPMLLPGMIAPLLNRLFYSRLKQNYVVTIGVVMMLLGGILIVLLNLIHLKVNISYWWWVIPGILANLSINAIYPIVSILGYRDIKTSLNAAASVFSIALYCSGGIGIYVCSLLSLDTVYVYGSLMAVASIIAFYLFKSDFRKYLVS